MALKYPCIDEEVRQYMLQEFNHDVQNKTLYLSPRLTDLGRLEYPELLRAAIKSHSDAWLGNELIRLGYIAETELGRRGGKEFVKKVPHNAHETLSEGEFNRFYIRGLAQKAIKDGVDQLIICRGKEVENPRRESEIKLGTTVNPVAVLQDLRTSPGIESALGIPPGPNSGLTLKLPS